MPSEQTESSSVRRPKTSCLAQLLALLLVALPAGAQSPGSATIEGTIELPGAALSSTWVLSAREEGSNRTLASTQTLSGAFSLSVPIDATGKNRILLSANGRASVAGSTSQLVRLPWIPLTARNGDVLSVSVEQPLALVRGVVPAGDIQGTAVSRVRVSTFEAAIEPTIGADVIGSSASSPGAAWEAVALAEVPVRIRRTATTSGSSTYHLDDVVATLAAGEVLDLGVEPLPAAQETLDWQFEIVGPRVFNTVSISSNTLDSATRFSGNASLDSAQQASGTSTGLVAGKHWPLVRFGGAPGYVTVPRAFAPPVEPSASYSASLARASVSGDIVFAGTAAREDVSSFLMQWQEPGERVADHHARTVQVGAQRLDYVAQLTQGDWQPTYQSFSLRRVPGHPDGPLRESLQRRAIQTFTVSLDPGEGEVAPDLHLGFGRVLLDLRDPSGLPYSISRVRAWCQRRDSGGELLDWSEIAAFPETTMQDSMTIELPQGQCEMDVVASNGSVLRSDLWVDLEEGDIVAMDLHPPTVTLDEPAGSVCADGALRVRGSATDPFGVLSVTLDGTPATLNPTGSSDPMAVSFDELVPLTAPGSQNVALVAKDLGGAETLLLLPVRNDAGPPVFDLPLGPVTTTQASYRLVGQVTDDDTLAEVRLDGVVLSSGGQATFDLDVDLPLQPGDNVFELEADDLCGQTTTLTFVVQLILGNVERVTGGGHIAWPDGGDRTTFGFVAQDKSDRLKGQLTVVRHGATGNYRLKSETLLSLSGAAGAATLRFLATYTAPDGSERVVQVTLWVMDAGEPGVGVDRFWIDVRDEGGAPVPALSLPAPAATEALLLTGGNVQVR